jgi:hypothetical protein
MTLGMNGQWIGRFKSVTTAGLVVIDVDDLGTHYEGRAYVYDDHPGLPSSFVYFKTVDRSKRFRLTGLQTFPISPHTGEVTDWATIQPHFPGITFPGSVNVDFDWNSKRLKVNWVSNIGTSGSADGLPRTRAGAPSEYKPVVTVTSWKDFKAFAHDLEHRRYIFRGQRGRWRLRTNYHRTGRADLARFIAEDIKTLHRHLSARTPHVFNLAVPDENGAFFNLVQHHGYPTPLLDWTYSPYVGAFFAYQKITNSDAVRASDGDKVRVLVFDQRQWRSDYPQLVKITPSRPHFSVMEFIAINNERLVPQQSISSATNVDDIETYIRSKEKEANKEYLRVVDLPVKERPMVMQELSAMGITAGSLFPGLDGACEELRERFFML